MKKSWVARFVLAVVMGAIVGALWGMREASISSTADVFLSDISTESPPLVISTDSTPSVISTESSSGEISNASQGHIVHLNVPFVSQAPYRVWHMPYKEFCEEASVLSLHYWKQGIATPPADQLDAELKELRVWEEEHLGKWEDTNADETAQMLHERFDYPARVERNMTMDDMKAELDAGRPFIVPARGQELDSPYYTPPGPLYHMIVVIGYDDQSGEWIVNDPGTNTLGAGQRYAYDDLYDAIGDWSHDDQAPTGGKVMIFVE
jgi:hypothetical protein